LHYSIGRDFYNICQCILSIFHGAICRFLSRQLLSLRRIKKSEMKISYNWLKQFLKIDWKSDEIAALLTDLGLEVEIVEKYQSVKGGLEGIVVGHVLTCVKHPNADRLKVTTVDLGDGVPVQIVCGAANVAAGQKYR
jgi:tRNA-binding EMAP/Myf-like protein